MADKIDNIINSSVATLIGIVLLCSVVIPIGATQIAGLTGDASEYADILKVALTMSIIALIYGITRYFSKSRE